MGQFIISTYAMIPAHDDDRRYALTVVQEDSQWKLMYSNEGGHEYDWSFICDIDHDQVALQWCGDTPVILYHEESDNKLHLTTDIDPILTQHYLHNFYSC